MATPQEVNIPLPPLPEGWDGGESGFKVLGTVSSATVRNIEPSGPYFLAYARRVSRSISRIGLQCLQGMGFADMASTTTETTSTHIL